MSFYEKAKLAAILIAIFAVFGYVVYLSNGVGW